MRLVVPPQFRAAGKVWVVKRDQELDGVVAGGHPRDSERVWDALTYREDRVVALSRRVAGARKERVAFIHEVLHAVGPQRRRPLTPTQEERFISSVDDQLLSVLERLEWA